MGVIIGDALGMPVQFLSREGVQANPITKMEGYGTYNMPVGTWSDDGSMTLATMDSIYEKKGIDYDDIMERFIDWNFEGKYTPTGEAFDQGITCTEAIYNYLRDRDYKTCGRTGEYANGNGALMRIIPVCLHVYEQHKKGVMKLEEALAHVHQVTALTHNHLRAKMASGIYFFMVQAILDETGTLLERLQIGMDRAKEFYGADIANKVEWTRFARIENLTDFAKVVEDDIKSSGYVVDSLEAAVWSLITTDSFEEGLLRAVNLGDDTDTVGAIAGGLAGLYYGYESVPEEWRRVLCEINCCVCYNEYPLMKNNIRGDYYET